MFERLRGRIIESDAGSLALEVGVVIFGILIAFQIDRWAEDRRDRALEIDYLTRLIEDLQIEIQSMETAIDHAESRIEAVLLLEQAMADPSMTLEQPDSILVAIETSTWRSYPQINAFVYSELQSTGSLALVRSVSLRRDLANHYSTLLHHSRVGLDLNLQHQFDLLTAGVLTTAELRNIEEGSWNNTSTIVSPQRALQIIEELARRQDAVRLLPNIAQHHVFNLKVMELARDRSEAIVKQIEYLLEGSDS